MLDITGVATQGHFGDVEDRIVSMATQGFFTELEYVPPKILTLQIGISSSGSQIGITKGDGIQIRGSRGGVDVV